MDADPGCPKVSPGVQKVPHFPGFRTKLDTPGPRPSWSNKIFYISIRMNTAERRAERRRANIARKATIAQLKAEWEAVDWAYEAEQHMGESEEIEEGIEYDEDRERIGGLYVLHLKEQGMTDSDEIERNLAEYMIYLTNPSSYQEGDMDEDDGDDEGDILRTDLWASKDPRARLPGPKENLCVV